MKVPIVIAACLSLLVVQFSGAHLHADEAGLIDAVETSFGHSHDALGHHHPHPPAGAHGINPDGDNDHGGERDVSLLDPGLGTFKMPLAVAAAILLFLLVPYLRALTSASFVYRILSGRHTRWRPPLRAPPIAI